MNSIFQSPRIIKESNTGYFDCRIQDEMFTKRQIQCLGEINSESVNELILQFQYLYQLDSDKEITMYINSPGGEVSSGLALYDVMKAISCPVRTVCVGTAASMGAVLFAAGDKRDILPHGRVMIHDPLIAGGVGGSALQIQSISNSLIKTREIIGTILAEHTHKSLEEIYEKTAKDTYFYAEEAVEFGLADNIITHL